MSNRKQSSRGSTGQQRLTRFDVVRSCSCPRCHAPALFPCVRRNGNERLTVHQARFELAKALNA